MKILIFSFTVFPLIFPAIVTADQTIVAKKVTQAPVIDGKADDAVWSEAKEIITHDNIANIDITLKAVHTSAEIFFLVTFPDATESRQQKAWVWDKSSQIYKQGPSREDTFVFKWNLQSKPVDLSVYSDEPYESDVWYWKAERTDPVGYADDKIDRLTSSELPDSRKVTSKSGKTLYLQRLGDEGAESYKNTLFTEYIKDVMPHFKHQQPSGSRADIRAKGLWNNGRWTIEFQRKLDTGHSDDIQLNTNGTYQFGVSRYEIAGREPNPNSDEVLFGSGDVSENLFLNFEK